MDVEPDRGQARSPHRSRTRTRDARMAGRERRSSAASRPAAQPRAPQASQSDGDRAGRVTHDRPGVGPTEAAIPRRADQEQVRRRATRRRADRPPGSRVGTQLPIVARRCRRLPISVQRICRSFCCRRRAAASGRTAMVRKGSPVRVRPEGFYVERPARRAASRAPRVPSVHLGEPRARAFGTIWKTTVRSGVPFELAVDPRPAASGYRPTSAELRRPRRPRDLLLPKGIDARARGLAFALERRVTARAGPRRRADGPGSAAAGTRRRRRRLVVDPQVGRLLPALLPSPSAEPARFRQGQPDRAERSEPRSGVP